MTQSTFSDQALAMLNKLKESPETFKNLERNFNGTHTFEELFSMIWDLKESHELLTVKIISSGKSKDEADNFRKMGSDFYVMTDFSGAIECYNNSIVVSPHPLMRTSGASVLAAGDEGDADSMPRIPLERYGGIDGDTSLPLAMGYANRSAVLFKCNAFEKCLQDILLALQYGYPDKFRKKLKDRSKKCLQSLKTKGMDGAEAKGNEPEEKADELESAAELVDKLEQGEPGGLEALTRRFAKLAVIRTRPPSLDEELAYKLNELPRLGEPNPFVPSLSSALKVAYMGSKGRCIVATRNIRPGEVVGLERAYCINLDENKLHTYCSSCMTFCLTSLPCPSCRKVVYCSEACRIKGLEEDHWIECAILPSMYALGIGNRNFAYKLLKSITFCKLRDMLNEIQNNQRKNPEEFGFDRNGTYTSTSYEAVHYLCTNKEKVPFEYLFINCQLSFIITKLLHLSGRFFIDDNGQAIEPTKEDLIMTGGVIFANVLKVRCNSFHVNDYKRKKSLGIGIFPTLSLINHACNPSLKNYSCGRYLIIRALRPITAGEEVTVSYTHDFTEELRDERRKNLETRYNFFCRCEACERQWPLLFDMSGFELNPKAKYARQGREEIQQQVKDTVRNFREQSVKIASGKKLEKEDFEFLCKSIEVMYTYVSVPSQPICSMENMLLRCFEAGF